MENAVGIILARWRFFRQPIIAMPQNAGSVVKATEALHNFLTVRQSAVYCPSGFADAEVNGSIFPESRRDGSHDASVTAISRAPGEECQVFA